jgi:hypothetical protein
MKRRASQATATATNLSEEARNDIYVRPGIRGEHQLLIFTLAESCSTPEPRSTGGLSHSCSR